MKDDRLSASSLKPGTALRSLDRLNFGSVKENEIWIEKSKVEPESTLSAID